MKSLSLGVRLYRIFSDYWQRIIDKYLYVNSFVAVFLCSYFFPVSALLNFIRSAAVR